MWGYIKRSASTIVRTYSMYRPLKVFLSLGMIMFTLGFLVGARYLYFFFNGEGGGHIQSLILSSILLTIGFQLGMFGLVADAIAANRRINDEILYRIKRLEYDKVDKVLEDNDNKKKQFNYQLEIVEEVACTKDS